MGNEGRHAGTQVWGPGAADLHPLLVPLHDAVQDGGLARLNVAVVEAEGVAFEVRLG